MAYTFSTGNTPATGPVAIYLLISTLITAGWTKVSDSDGSTYSAGGTQVTSGNGGANGLGNVLAWVRMRAPTVGSNQREITFQQSNTIGAPGNLLWRIKYSANAGFIGGSPGISQTPSAADEVFMLGGGTDASPTFTSWFTTNGTYRWHIACGGATELYSFVAFAMLSTTTTGSVGIFLDVMANGTYPATDVDPAVMAAFPAGLWPSGNMPGFGPPNTNVTNPAYARAWLGPTSAAGASLTSNNVNVGMSPYGSLGQAYTFVVNPFSGNDSLWSPTWISATGSRSPIGYKGISTLFYFGSVLRTNMDTCTTVGSKDRVYIAQNWSPWDGSTPTL